MKLANPQEVGLRPELPQQLRAEAERQISDGLARGMQLFVARRGKVVVDCALGCRVQDDQPVTTATRFAVMSDSKPITAMTIHLLAERGELVYADPIARFVAEFDQNMKGTITFHHGLLNRAGIADFHMRWVPPETFADWDHAIAEICALPLEALPGTEAAYHPLTVWAMFAEVVQRVDGRAFPDFCAQEIFGPLGMRRTTWGLADDLLPEASELGSTLADDEWTDRWRRLRSYVIPGATLWSTAADLGRFYMLWGGGGAIDGVRLLSPATVRLATSKLGEPWQPELQTWMGYGFAVGTETGRYTRRGSLASQACFGFGGYTVSNTWCDPVTDLVFVTLSNLALDAVVSDRRFHQLSDIVHRAVLPDD